MKQLRSTGFATYAVLCHYFKRYVKKRRERKTKEMKKLVAQELYKNVLKEKMRFGMSKTHLNVRKLQKFREWLLMTKIERIKCLKVLWKNNLLELFKLSSEAETLSICKSQ